MPAITGYFAWGCFRYFGWARDAARLRPMGFVAAFATKWLAWLAEP